MSSATVEQVREAKIWTPRPNASGPEAIRETVARAREATGWWSGLSIRERGRHLLAFRKRLVERYEELVAVVGRETNKPRFDVMNEIIQSCNTIGYYARKAPKFLKKRSIRPNFLMHKVAEVHYRPMGVIGVITPWNYPVVLVLSPVVQSLITGNTVVLKPSERAEQTALFLQELWDDLALPHPVLQTVTGGPETAIALAESAVDKISFTGGTRGGKAIAAAAAKNLTPCLMELGGNDAMLVDVDADVDRAAAGAAWGAFLNAGQSCVGVERIFVHKGIADEFLKKLCERARSLSVGLSVENEPSKRPGPDHDHDVGPLVTEAQFEHVKSLIADAIERGAKVEVGGLPDGSLPERCMRPTVLTGVKPDMRIMREEAFGPVVSVVAVDDMDEAVRMANDSEFGLGGSVWSRDRRRAAELAAKVHAGGVGVNDCLIHFAVCEVPFGGVKQSGFGRTHGPEGLREYVSPQTIVFDQAGLKKELHWFPYENRHNLLVRIMKWMFGNPIVSRFR